MEPKFKVGDKVRIAKRRYRSGDYRFHFIDDMTKYSGQISIIKNVHHLSPQKYTVEDDGMGYNLTSIPHIWSSGMLEPVESVVIEDDSCLKIKPPEEDPTTEREPLKIRVKSKRIMFNFKN